ncbi:MAG: choice-of-anchor I family protein [Opitutales bacterium]
MSIPPPHPWLRTWGPEGLVFVSGMDSPTGSPLLIVANEVSGTTTVYKMQGNFPLHPVSDLIIRSGTDALHLQWKDTNNQEQGYDVYRKANDETVFSKIATLSANVSNWSDETVVSGKSYAYRVDAYNASYTSSSTESELFAPIKPILNLLSTYNPAKEDYAEVPAFDPFTNRIFVSNGKEKRVDVMEVDRKGVVTFKFSLPIPSTFGGINAVSVSNGILAVAVEAPVKQNNGGVLFYDTRVKNGGSPITTVSVGALPDHLTFTPDGLKLVVANEGEPSDDYTNDPKGSISIIDVSKINQIRNDASSTLTLPVTTLDFTAYDSKKAELIAKGVRIFGKNASVSQDLEPEYVAISADSAKAFVTLQENNALAFVDLVTSSITDIKPLGFKDYNALGLAFDSNDKDKSYNPYPWPVLGMYQPDSIVSFTIDNAGPPVFQEVNSASTNAAFTGGSISPSYRSRSIATFAMTGAEISDYDPINKILYVVGGGNVLLTVNLSNPAIPVLDNNISLGATAQSVAVKNGYVAIALSNSTDKTQNGTVALYSVATKDKNASLVTTFTAGALPDSVAFSSDGNVIVVANEGEPNDAYTVDPEGSITVIRLNRKNPTASVVHQLGFSSFTASNLTAAGVRLSGPNKNVPTKDLEPEYVTIAPNGEKAFVSLQENNAIAIIDLLSDIPKIESVVGAGIKDWSVGGLIVDTTDKDSGVNFGSASFKGLNMPDGMDAYTAGDGRTYFIAANEGDGREYEYTNVNGDDVISYTDENRSKDFGLTIGGGNRIKMTTWDKNGDGSISADERFAFGGRSFTIYDDEGTLVFDSGDLLDTKANEVGSYPDGRSDDKGSEPEGVEIANIGGRSIAFIAMERSSTVAVFDVTNPKDSVFLEMIKLNASLVSPEGLKYISAKDSGNGKDLLVISAEYKKGIEIIEFSPPSAMDVYSSEFLITANEGDARDYGGYSEETRVGKLTLDYNGTGLHKFSPDYPDADQDLTADKFNLSRLKTTTANGDIDGDGKYEEIYSYGARSFSIWSAKDGSLVYDSGVDLEKIVQQTYPDKFNIDDDDVDKRSDDKGVEPEGLAVGEVDGRTFAFIGLERQSGIIIYDVTDPLQPHFVQYANNRDYSKSFDSKEAGDVGPEGLTFVSADNSPTGYPLLIVTNEVSGSTSVWGMSNLPVGPVKGLNIHQDADVSILSWDDTSSVENGFIIYRQEGIGNPYIEIGRVGSNITRFYDVDFLPGVSYSYKVNAYNDVSESNGSETKESTSTLRLTILHANDAEKLMPTTLGSGSYGGAALFVSKMRELRSEYGSKGHGILSVSAGDNLMPGRELSASTLPLFSHFMDQAGFEFAAIGNHEFDAGPDTTATFIESAKNPTFLSSNLDFSSHKPLNDLFTSNKIVKSTLVDVDVAGTTLKVGIVGATTKNLSFISSPSPVTVDIDVASKVQAEVNSLSSNGAKIIILLSHLQGVTEELSLLTQVSGVDVVVAGGGDNRLANPSDKLIPGDTAEGPYPLIGTDKDGSSVPVVTVDGQLKYIGRLTLNVTTSGEITGWNGGPNRVVDSGIDQFHGSSPDLIAYETIEKPVSEYVSGLSAQKISNEIGFSLNGAKDDIRARETNLGNLVADSQLWVAQTYASAKNAPVADVALANGGGIRSSINESGEAGYKVSVDDTYAVLPFGNIVSVVPDITSAEFKLLLENAYSKTITNLGGNPQRSGDGNRPICSNCRFYS